MHECAGLLELLVVGLNHTHVCCRFVAPTVSPYASAKVCLTPVPEFGVAASAVTTGGAPTVQVPRVCHPLVCAPLLAYMKMLCDPANAGVNVSANVSVNVFPLGTAVLLPNAIAHWLFCRVPVPIGADSHVPPASLSRLSRFVPAS